MSMLEPVVAVIGGGAIATAFIRQLADCATRGGMRRIASVCVFEPRESPGAGDGCTSPHPSALLDAAAASMSVLHDEPMHFFDWATQHQAQWREMHPELVLHPQAHLPRALFGRYLQAVYDEAVATLRNTGVVVHHIRSAVKAVQPLKPLQVPCAEHAVVTESGATYAANVVALASTNTDATPFDHLRHHAGYLRWPRQGAAGELSLHATASVVILGNGASAVDAAIALEDAGHRGRITVVSRSGLLPLDSHSVARVELPCASRFSREAIQAWAHQRGGTLSLAEVGELLLRHFNAASTGPAGSGELHESARCRAASTRLAASSAAPTSGLARWTSTRGWRPAWRASSPRLAATPWRPIARHEACCPPARPQPLCIAHQPRTWPRTWPCTQP